MRRRLKSTANTDPTDYSWSRGQSRWRSFAFALAGCAYMLRYQKNTRIMAAATAAVLIAGWWLGIDALRWAVLVLAVAQVWLAEFINAAVEAAVDVCSPGFHPLAKVAKDVAAGAVLMASAAALLIGVLVLAPQLLETLQTR